MKECHVRFDQSQRRISYIHLCKNTKSYYPLIRSRNVSLNAELWRTFQLEHVLQDSWVKLALFLEVVVIGTASFI